MEHPEEFLDQLTKMVATRIGDQLGKMVSDTLSPVVSRMSEVAYNNEAVRVAMMMLATSVARDPGVNVNALLEAYNAEVERCYPPESNAHVPAAVLDVRKALLAEVTRRRG